MSSRAVIVVLGLVAAAALFLVLRPDGDGEASDEPPATTGTTTSTTTATTETRQETEPPPPPGPPPPARVRVSVEGGAPVGGIRRATVARGRRVVLVVTSDVADEVHLHGYDISRDVAPGEPARIAFRATLAGRFEAELEDGGVQILDLQVNP